MDAMIQGLNCISLFVFSLILTNAASVHSANTHRQLAALEPNTILVEHDDQGHPAAPAIPPLKPFTATTSPATTATVTTTEKPMVGAMYLSSSPFPPEASCMIAIWSLIVDIPTPGPALSAALNQAKATLAPSAMASPQCTITLPATLSSEYGVYISKVDSWVSKHSKELDTLDSVCAETSIKTGRMSAHTSLRVTGAGPGSGCTAPVAVFTGDTSVGTGTNMTTDGGRGGGSSTAKATGSGDGVMTSMSTKSGTITSSVTGSLTGSATTVAGATSLQSVSAPQAGVAARVTGVVAAAMVVAGFLAVVVVAL